MSSYNIPEYYGGASDNKSLITYLKSKGHIKSENVYNLMSLIDRKHFVTNPSIAYIDMPVAVGYQSTLSAPHLFAIILELLSDKLVSGNRALDISLNTGYQTVVFASAFGKDGSVIAVLNTFQNSMVHVASTIIKHYYPHIAGRVEFVDLEIYSSKGPYDIIHVGEPVVGVPRKLLELLSFGGRLVVPLVINHGSLLTSFDKGLDGKFSAKFHLYVKYENLLCRDISSVMGNIPRNNPECEKTVEQIMETLNKLNEDLIEENSEEDINLSR